MRDPDRGAMSAWGGDGALHDEPHPNGAPLTVTEASELAGRVLDEVQRAVVGKRGPLTLVLAAVLAKGHVLLEDFPGLGKTLAARSFAQVLGLDFARAQFTPDLLPSDLTGSFLYNQQTSEFTPPWAAVRRHAAR